MSKICARLKYIALVYLSVVLFSAQVFSQAIDELVLIVDDQAITAREFSVLSLIHDPSKSYALVTPELGEPITDAIVNELLLAGHAKRLAADAKVNESEVDAAIETLSRQNKLSKDQLLSNLKAQGVDMQIFRDSLRQRLLVQQVVAKRVARSINVSQSEIEEYINNRPELKSQTQKKYRASHLVIPISEGLSKREVSALRKVAEKARVRLLAGEPFATIIADSEQIQSSGKGGDLGWKKQNELPALFVNALKALKVKEVSPIVESENGFHLLALTGLDAAGGKPKEYKLRHILKRLSPKDNVNEMAGKLNNLKLQILAGVDFSKAAQTESEDTASALNGGDLGWIKAQQIEPRIAQVMLSMEVGQISDPIRTKAGLHLIQLMETREQAGGATLESKVQQQIYSEKVEEVMQDLLNEIKQIALIEVVSG